MKAYKGFEPGLICRGFQFAEGATFEHEGDVSLCASGFHAVEMPIDVLAYYPPDTSVYRIVELEDVTEKSPGDSKVAGRKITLGAEVDVAGLVKAQFDMTWDRAEKKPGNHKKNESGAASATGDSGAASATGDSGAASATGESGAASATGERGAASATGERGAASATGWSGAASATGESGAASVEGPESVAIVTGYQGRASGALGCWIVLTERDVNWHIIEVRAVKVDGEMVKAGVFYMLRSGELVEAS